MTRLRDCFKYRGSATRGRALLWAAAAVLAFVALPAAAKPECTISATPVDFGSYNVYAATANNNGVGTLQVSCKDAKKNLPVKLSTGQSNGYASRLMKSGANPLTYNLYSNAARTTIWGDGKGGSSVVNVDGNADTTLQVYGRIPAGQDVAVGSYTDSITVTIEF